MTFTVIMGVLLAANMSSGRDRISNNRYHDDPHLTLNVFCGSLEIAKYTIHHYEWLPMGRNLLWQCTSASTKCLANWTLYRRLFLQLNHTLPHDVIPITSGHSDTLILGTLAKSPCPCKFSTEYLMDLHDYRDCTWVSMWLIYIYGWQYFE